MPYPSDVRPSRIRPKKPMKGRGIPRSEHIARKSQTWVSDGSIVNGKETRSNRSRTPRLREYKKPVGSETGALAAKQFLFDNRFFKVPVHEWGKKGRTLLV